MANIKKVEKNSVREELSFIVGKMLSGSDYRKQY